MLPQHRPQAPEVCCQRHVFTTPLWLREGVRERVMQRRQRWQWETRVAVGNKGGISSATQSTAPHSQSVSRCARTSCSSYTCRCVKLPCSLAAASTRLVGSCPSAASSHSRPVPVWGSCQAATCVTVCAQGQFNTGGCCKDTTRRVIAVNDRHTPQTQHALHRRGMRDGCCARQSDSL